MFTVIYWVGYGNQGLWWGFWPLQKNFIVEQQFFAEYVLAEHLSMSATIKLKII